MSDRDLKPGNVSPWRLHADKTMTTAAGGLLVRGPGSRWASWRCARCKSVSPAPGPEPELLEPFTQWRDLHAGAACEPVDEPADEPARRKRCTP